MNYGLTLSQVEVVKWMVSQVSSGNLREEMLMTAEMGSESLVVLGHSGTVPSGLTSGALQVLEASGFIRRRALDSGFG